MADDTRIDVLIIGAGASGAAVAWSLAETRMRIVCLEQGGWMNPAEVPEQRPRLGNAPVRRVPVEPEPPRKRAADYPINDDDSPIAILNFNAVGGSTILYSAHFPRFHPSDFRVKTLDGVADDWPIDYWASSPISPRTTATSASRASRGTRPSRSTSRRCHPCRWGAWARPWGGASTSLAGIGGRRTRPS